MKLKYKAEIVNFYKWAHLTLFRRQTVYFLIVITIFVGLIFQFSVIPPGASTVESEYLKDSSSLSAIISNPLSLPHKLPTYLVSQIFSSVRYSRSISIIFFGLCTFALYRILKRWHSDKIALLSTVLFASNATVLAIARLGSPLVLLFGWSLIISALLWLRHGSSRNIAPIFLAIIATALFYVPGAPYFFLLFIAIFLNKILTTIRTMKPRVLYIGLFLSLLMITPLVYSIMKDVSVLKEWLLLPEGIIWSDVPRNVLRVPSAFIYRAPVEPLLNVGRLPIFDVASGGTFLIGIYAYQKNLKLKRTKVMLLTALLSVILGMLGQVTLAVLILLPFVYSIIGAGLSYILDEWYSVFPKNPFARSFGLLLVTFVVIMSVYYQLTRFLIVWPNTPETRSIYNQSRIVE